MSHINDTLKRINELAAKKKSGQELTPEELAEKKELYEIYLSFIRGQITSTLDLSLIHICWKYLQWNGQLLRLVQLVLLHKRQINQLIQL